MANTDIITIDTDKMRTVAGTIENQMNIIKNCYNNIRTESENLKGVWEGASAQAYFEKINQLCTQQQAGKMTATGIENILKEYVHDLNTIANEYDRNEGRLTDRAEGLSTDVFGI